MIPRHLTPRLFEALADTPVVFLQGARQVGKTTLVKSLAQRLGGTTYLTLDTAATRSAARADPEGFLEHSGSTLMIDEVQKVPELFSALKRAVDEDRRPGRFLLTGSTNPATLPGLSQELVGRMEIWKLWPCTIGELGNHQDGFVGSIRAVDPLKTLASAAPVDDLVKILAGTGFPEPAKRSSWARRRSWFSSFVTTTLERDIRDMARISDRVEMERILRLLAGSSGRILNQSRLASHLSIPISSLRRYLSLFEATHLVQLVPAWFSNRSKRAIKAPKIHLIDRGLITYLNGTDPDGISGSLEIQGNLIENLVVTEVLKQISWMQNPPRLYHYRTRPGKEVDLVLEYPNGSIIGIEVKRSRSVGRSDFKGLKDLAEAASERFRYGIVLYQGDEPLSFGDRFRAIPLGGLWL